MSCFLLVCIREINFHYFDSIRHYNSHKEIIRINDSGYIYDHNRVLIVSSVRPYLMTRADLMCLARAPILLLGEPKVGGRMY